MNKGIFRILIACALLLISQVSSAAEPEVAVSREDESGIYLAGNPDFYPIEYYDKEEERFAGVMPLILDDISNRTGLKFTYLHDGKFTQTELADNLQVEIVSSYITDSSEAFAADTVTFFSYEDNGKTVNIGLAFTQIADEDIIRIIKSEAADITENDINGYFVAAGLPKQADVSWIVITAVLISLFLIVATVTFWLRLKKTVRQLHKNKMTDRDTGIGNISYFEHQFENAISEYSRPLYYVAYIIIDSNFLQMYYGESSFTDAVKYAANVLTARSGGESFAARITENSFALAYQSSSEEEAKRHIEGVIRKLNISTGVEDKNIKPSFHAAVYNLHSDDFNSELILLNLRRNCNKIVGTDTQIVFCDVHAMNSAIEEKKLIDSFSDGFKNKEFKLYLQFIVDNKTKKIISAEALSRWDNPDRGFLNPGKYIDSMESVGMISELDFYMFEAVCMQLHKWKDTEFGDLTISCNFTRITLSEENFIEKIREITSKYVFDRSKLIIEITEDAIEKNIKNALDSVYECKKMGFLIALDDLGSGYTSLSNLCDYPVDIVKIDRDILLKTEKETGKELFKGIVALAHSLRKKVVCEGVESAEQHEFVTASDCDSIQGWYYSRVFPAKESENYYRQYSGAM